VQNSGENKLHHMARGPSTGTVSGHLGEARRTIAAGPRQPLPKARDERIIWKFQGQISASFAVHSTGHHQMGRSLLNR
jgi:hypothetical protein